MSNFIGIMSERFAVNNETVTKQNTPIADEIREAGSYLLSLPLHGLPSGAYTVRLTTKNTEGIPTRQIQSLILNH
jgi:hypothetical protein